MAEDRDQSSLPLGRTVSYPQAYDASLLYPLPRGPSRAELGLDPDAPPFYGEDIWNAYELSWLELNGKPVIAQAEFRVPAHSPAMIESKSLKLYLNSLNQTRFDGRDAVAQTLVRDLSAAAGCQVGVTLSEPSPAQVMSPLGTPLDDLDVAIEDDRLGPEQLTSAGTVISECLYSHLLRSLCPVTGQPDWATLVIEYRGSAIDRAGLLRYIVGYRQHQAFHEQCIERIYCDILRQCQPQSLLVYARYLRRGGLDINPYRSDADRTFSNLRFSRQ